VVYDDVVRMKTDDPKFTELALKVIAGQATEVEQAQLQALLVQPELAKEFEELKGDAGFARKMLPMLGSVEVEAGPVPGYARSRLRNLMNQPAKAEPARPSFSWRWVWGLAASMAVITLVVVFNLPAHRAPVQFAMLDSMGTMRGGTNDATVQFESALKESFGQTNLTTFSGDQELDQWLKQWPEATTAKIVYDRDAGVVRVMFPPKNDQLVTKSFPVAKESDLPAVLKKAADSLK
jgi:hypothetical protein